MSQTLYFKTPGRLILGAGSISELPDAVKQLGARKPFVVTVDRTPVYAGTFMAAWFSRSADDVVILWPSMELGDRTFRIQLGYPGAGQFTGTDPRSDGRVLDALERAGKLN